MQSGKLRHRITIQYLVSNNRDDSGMETGDTWVDLATVWADVDDLSTKDTIADRTVQGTMQARAVIRYSQTTDRIDTTMRVLFEGVFYRIDGNPKRDLCSRREYLTLNLAEGLKEWD